jgi:signal transduction histidine kinase
MKKAKVLSLFFILLFNSSLFFGQQKIDSLSYYSKLVDSPEKITDLSTSYRFFNNYFKIVLHKKDTTSAIYALWYKASIEHQTGFYYDSEKTSINALKLSDRVKPTAYLKVLRKGIFNHLGIIYRKKGNINKAINLYDRALILSESKKDSAIIFNNTANVHKDNNDLKSAKEYAFKAYNIIKKTNDTLSIALILDNLGFIKMKMNIKGALNDLNTALKLREQKNDISTIYTSYNHLFHFYKKKKQNKKAREYALKANNIAIKINNAAYKQDALGMLLELSNDTYAKQYKIINDNQILSEQKRNNKFALIKYDLVKQEELTKESELKTEKEKSTRLIYQFIGLFILLASIFLYFILKSRHKKEKLIEVYKTETRISKKVHDEVANDVYHVMTKLQSNSNINEDLLDDLEDIYTKTRDISKENSILDVNEDFDELLKDLLLSYKSNTINVITRNISKVDWQKVSSEKKTTIYRVLQELMTNMKKHSKASLVVLTFNQSNKLIINYSDNGIGSEIKKHNGLQNAENRIQSINGTITFESQITNGFKVKITL